MSARNVASCSNHGYNQFNKHPATALQGPKSPTRTTCTTTADETVSRRLCAQTQTTARRHGLGGDYGGSCGHVSSSISGTKVAEDKT